MHTGCAENNWSVIILTHTNLFLNKVFTSVGLVTYFVI